MFNTTIVPFQDKRVRQALAMSVDREAIVRSVTRGDERPAYHFTPPNTVGYTARARVRYDPGRARRLLAEAGYPQGDGFPKVTLLYNTLESHKTVAEAIQQMWKKQLNIDIVLENQEWKVYLNSKTHKNYQIVRFGWIADYEDPNAFLDLWLSEGGHNDSGWKNPEYDRLIAAAGRATDPQQRFEFFQQAEMILLEELPILPLYFYTSTYLLHPAVKNWNPTILDHQPYKYVYLDDARGAQGPVTRLQ
jgi:oligopeptide transport system substrate-binding protein